MPDTPELGNAEPVLKDADLEPDGEVWTRFDEAMVESFAALNKRGDVEGMFALFAAYSHTLSDSAYWYMLGMLWNRDAAMELNAFWLKHFGEPRPGRSGLMKKRELDVVLSLDPLVAGYRPQADKGGLHPFIFCADKITAMRHAQVFGSQQIGTYSIPATAVVAFFQRTRGPEVLVLDCSGVQLEDVTPVTVLT